MKNTGHELTDFDVEVVKELVDERYLFDCNVIRLTDNIWAIHGPIAVGGESILAEFATREDAELALQMLSEAEKRHDVETREH
jgi:hypothetical protein